VDGRNYRPKHVQLIEIINKIITVASSWLFILLVSVMHGHTNIKQNKPLLHSVKNEKQKRQLFENDGHKI